MFALTLVMLSDLTSYQCHLKPMTRSVILNSTLLSRIKSCFFNDKSNWYMYMYFLIICSVIIWDWFLHVTLPSVRLSGGLHVVPTYNITEIVGRTFKFNQAPSNSFYIRCTPRNCGFYSHNYFNSCIVRNNFFINVSITICVKCRPF